MKNKNFAFRISENDLNKIKTKAKKAHLTVTDYLTRQALDKSIGTILLNFIMLTGLITFLLIKHQLGL